MKYITSRGTSIISQGTKYCRYQQKAVPLHQIYKPSVLGPLSYFYRMAKITLPPGASLDEVAAELQNVGMTLDRHRYPDGTYRVYVRKENMATFADFINQQINR